MTTPETYRPEPSEAFPNNPDLPVLLYRGALNGSGEDVASEWESRFQSNGWGGCWRWSVYDFHHFHSNAHEALGVASGSAQITLGGPQGRTFEVRAGDLMVLPAGTGHKNEGASPDFQVVGAYPKGQEDYDLRRGDPGEHDDALSNIEKTPLPESDPAFGKQGPLMREWS